MSRVIVLENIVDATYKRLGEKVSKNEIRRSMALIAARWYSTVSIGDKWDIAREVGGNRYIGTSFEILDALFSELLHITEDTEGDDGSGI